MVPVDEPMTPMGRSLHSAAGIVLFGLDEKTKPSRSSSQPFEHPVQTASARQVKLSPYLSASKRGRQEVGESGSGVRQLPSITDIIGVGHWRMRIFQHAPMEAAMHWRR